MPTPLEIKKIGKNYQVKFDNGSIYKGGWLNGKMHGIGTLTFSNGDSYKGDFVDGKRLGKGEYNFSNGDSYKGDFVNGKRHGKGVYNFSNGEIYKGDFVDGKKGGMGTFLLSSGASVSGFFKKDIFIPDAKKEAKLSRKIIILEKSSATSGNITPAIASSYGIDEDQIKIINEETAIPSITDSICKRKGDLEAQIVVTINDHGDDEGNFVNQDFIKEKLAELSAKIRVYNQLEANEEKVKRVKLNLKTCYGDACITTSLLEIIRTFTDDGIEVRTSAIKGDSTSSSIVGNGKNYADADDTKTVIVERLFTSSKPDAEKFESEKAAKYQNIQKSEHLVERSSIFCTSGEKHYKDLAAFLQDEYNNPNAEVGASEASSLECKKTKATQCTIL